MLSGNAETVHVYIDNTTYEHRLRTSLCVSDSDDRTITDAMRYWMRGMMGQVYISCVRVRLVYLGCYAFIMGDTVAVLIFFTIMYGECFKFVGTQLRWHEPHCTYNANLYAPQSRTSK